MYICNLENSHQRLQKLRLKANPSPQTSETEIRRSSLTPVDIIIIPKKKSPRDAPVTEKIEQKKTSAKANKAIRVWRENIPGRIYMHTYRRRRGAGGGASGNSCIYTYTERMSSGRQLACARARRVKFILLGIVRAAQRVLEAAIVWQIGAQGKPRAAGTFGILCINHVGSYSRVRDSRMSDR